MIELVNQTELYYAREDAKQENVIKTINSMLTEKCPLNLISKVTDKLVKEIKDIQKSMI